MVGRLELNTRHATARVRSVHASPDFRPREQREDGEGWGGIEAERKGPACN